MSATPANEMAMPAQPTRSGGRAGTPRQERGEHRSRCDDEARSPGAHGLLAEVDAEMVDGDAEEAGYGEAREILGPRQAHAREDRVRSEYE